MFCYLLRTNGPDGTTGLLTKRHDCTLHKLFTIICKIKYDHPAAISMSGPIAQMDAWCRSGRLFAQPPFKLSLHQGY
jgi:hypothetical protein